ncbi:MAG: hypothetical protein JXA67_20415 [Micromonosporaceae bacterium]|nr:hypothetical protein [Micromonosporaceae bacterium]
MHRAKRDWTNVISAVVCALIAIGLIVTASATATLTLTLVAVGILGANVGMAVSSARASHNLRSIDHRGA